MQNKIDWLCLLRDNCSISIKKLFSVITMGLVIYLSIWTSRDLYDLLAFIAVLLGIRAWERSQSSGYSYHDNNNEEFNNNEKTQ